jgi:4-aminobutyrate aminotransferase / (S)-3-amino-2-methylpropionate transaminase / 5-aminovalerate transaminase
MLALELLRDRHTREPASALAATTVARARERGLIAITCGPHANVIRILVPLTAPDALVDEGLGILEGALELALHES